MIDRHGAAHPAAVTDIRVRVPVQGRPIVPRETGALRRFDRDQEIFGEGDDADCVYEVVAGTVRTSKLLSDGRRQIDAFHLPGDIFGIETGPEHRFSAEAIGDATIRVIRRCDFSALAKRDPRRADQLLGALAQSLVRAQEHMLLLGRKCAREKIASFLLELAGRLEGASAVELPMSRTDIADHLGLTIETVSRTLTQLQRETLIDLPKSRRTIVLRNRSALRQLAAGNKDEAPGQLARIAARASAHAAH